MSYNGWTNRETWLVNVWFNPESKSDLDWARDYIDEEWDKLPGILKDMCNIQAIDWDELYSEFKNESEDESEEEEE